MEWTEQIPSDLYAQREQGQGKTAEDRRQIMFPNNSPRHGQLGGYQQQPGYEYGGGGGVYGDQWPPNYHLYR